MRDKRDEHLKLLENDQLTTNMCASDYPES